MLRIRRFLAWMAINLVTGLATITLAIWWMAYVSPALSITVMVDRFGEAAAVLEKHGRPGSRYAISCSDWRTT